MSGSQHQPFEVYKLVEGRYQLQLGEPFWMPEVGLGIGRFQSAAATPQELLCWFGARGDRYLTPEERAEQAERAAEQAERAAEQAAERAARLAARLRQLGEDPDQI